MERIETSVADLMSMPVVVISPEALAGEVLALAQTSDVHHFPIVDGGRLVGIVCTCDLEDEAPDSPVLPQAWHHVVTAPPECSTSDAARLMRLHGVGSLVIVDGEGLCGIVTREDLLLNNSDVESLLQGAKCVTCSARRHLRPGANGECLCKKCLANSQP